MNVEFNPNTHTYYVDGRKVPGVTQIVAPLGEDYDQPDDLTESVLEAAADRGTVLHDYIAFRLTGGEAEDYEMEEIYAPYAEAVEAFFSEHAVIPLLIETPLAAADFAGTPDLVAEMDGETAILDWKFVSQVAKSKVGAQLGGYRRLCEEEGIYPDKLYAVQFLRSGDYRLYPVGLASGEEMFKACWHIWQLKTKRHPRGKIGGDA